MSSVLDRFAPSGFAMTLLLPAMVLPVAPTVQAAEAVALPPAGVALVRVDATVTGRDGRPVAGLTAADFEITENGRPQAIVSFAAHQRPGPRIVAPAPGPARPAPVAEAPAPATPPAAAEPRRFVFVIDDVHIAPANLAAARAALRRVMDEQLAPGDEAALVTTSGTTGPSQPLTADRAVLNDGLDRLALTQQRRPLADDVPHLTAYQAERIERGDVEALRVAVAEIQQEQGDLDEGMARLQAAARAHAVLAQVLNDTRQSLGTLESVVRSLEPLAGRKVVILVSDGFLAGIDAADSRYFDVRRVIDAAARARVVVYSLDSRGLVSEVPGGDATFGGPPVFNAPGQRESLQMRSVEALRHSLTTLAEDTGGFLVRDGNDLGAAFGRILADNDSYYVLGYEPTDGKRDGSYRKIRVRLRGTTRGREVRARRGYFAADDRTKKEPETQEARRDRELASALESLYPLAGLPVRLAADAVDAAADGPRLVVKALLDVRGMDFAPGEAGREADLEIAGLVLDAAGRRAADIPGERSRLKLPAENAEAFLAEGLAYERTLALPPGRYQVRLAVRDGRAGLLGSASAWVELPDRAASPLTLDSIFLMVDDGTPEDDTSLTDVQVTKQVRRGQGLHYVVNAQTPQAGELSVQAQLWSGDRLAAAAPPRTVLASGSVTGVRLAERIDLQAFPPGRYELRIVVRQTVSAATARRAVPFEIVAISPSNSFK